MGKSGICKLSTLAILSGDMSNTSLSNCGNMRPHVTANSSSNCSYNSFTENGSKEIRSVDHCSVETTDFLLALNSTRKCASSILSFQFI